MIKLLTPISKTESYTIAQIERRVIVMLNTLTRIGETGLAEARASGNYKDRTGNLRNSLGYVVLNDGVVFSKGGKQDFIQTLVGKNSKGLVLIMAAGMNYAVYVEALNFNVLTSAELLAEQMLPQMMLKIGFKLR